MSDPNILALAWGPLRIVKTWPIYFVNGFKFHTRSHSIGKSTMNCGICVKGTGYGEYENDFYGQLEEIIQIEYPGLPLKRVVLFKCEWFDPTIGRGTKVNEQYGIIQIRNNRRYGKYDPFIIAHKAIQVYFAPHPISTRDKVEWWFVIKTKARGMIEDEQTGDFAYQEDSANQSSSHIAIDLDEPVTLLDNDGRLEEVDGINDGEEGFIYDNDDEEDDEVEEEEEELEEDENEDLSD